MASINVIYYPMLVPPVSANQHRDHVTDFGRLPPWRNHQLERLERQENVERRERKKKFSGWTKADDLWERLATLSGELEEVIRDEQQGKVRSNESRLDASEKKAND